MALRRLFTQNLGPISHLPTWMLIIGTVAFWLELYVFRLPGGHTSCLSWCLWGALAVVVLKNSGHTNFFYNLFSKVSVSQVFLGALALVYLSIVLLAALLPPHLVQEYDAINYHITIPRQHLILHGFAHIPWSVADLFLLPLDYALSPFWLSTALPNKFPQFIFLLGSLGLVFNIVYLMAGKDITKAAGATVAFMALHMTAIQSGTAMLDMVMLYCVLASIHSVLTGRFTLAAVEWAFFFWSKSFIPPMMIAVVGSVLLASVVLKRSGFTFSESYALIFRQRRRIFLSFIAASVIIAMPYIVKSVYYSGAPLYPFGVHQAWAGVHYEPVQWAGIVQRTQESLGMKDAYGHGRGIGAFIKHFWLIAVPEKGVNNAFDYPVGLIYLLVLGPFIISIVQAFRSKKVSVLSLFIVLWWAAWWMGSQQTRFLLIPMCLMIIVAIINMKVLSRIFIALVIAAMVLEIVSLTNAHRPDWGRSAYSVLRDKDKVLLQMRQDQPLGEPMVLDYPDVAFAAFPVIVRNNKDSIFVFPQ